jgi:hypothetical protein
MKIDKRRGQNPAGEVAQAPTPGVFAKEAASC